MRPPQEPPLIHIWGPRLFENDNDMKVVAEFNEQAGIQQLEDAANSKITDPALRVRYSLFARHCIGRNSVEAVRAHLDSGLLSKLAAKQVSSYFNPIKISDWTNHGYTCVLLAALAMNLGCRTYSGLKGYPMMNYNTYNEFLRGICITAPLTDEAWEQISVAASGPSSYKAGEPYYFGTQTRTEARVEANARGKTLTQVIADGGMPLGYKRAKIRTSLRASGSIGPCSKVDLQYGEGKDCGSDICPKPDAHLKCGRCQDQLYCSASCQKADWKRHKIVCRTPEDAAVMFDYPGKDADSAPAPDHETAMIDRLGDWMNIFDLGFRSRSYP